jgi:hypothetical protein
MQQIKNRFGVHYSRLVYGAAIVAWLIYGILTFFNSNAGSNQLHLSPTDIVLIRISIAIPYLVIWLTAAYAYLTLRAYAHSLPEGKEHTGFNLLSIGTGIFGASLMASTLAGALKNTHPEQLTLDMVLTIIGNYCYILPYCVAFYLMFRAVKHIVNRESQPHISVLTVSMVAGLMVFAYFWLDLIFTNTTRTISANPSIPPTYFLNDPLIILTIVGPSFLAWVYGMLASTSFWHYYRNVKGRLYRQALSALVNGMLGVTLSSIFLNAILSLGATRILALGLGPILAIIYGFQIVLIVGFVYIARGAKKLTKIETV